MAKETQKTSAPREKDCIIIGGGPSIKGQEDKIKEAEAYKIGCNKAFKYFDIDALTYFDAKFEREYREHIAAFKGAKYAPRDPCHSSNHFDGLGTTYIKRISNFSIDLRGGLYMGVNCGTFALSLAMARGFNKIFMLGMDCRLSDAGESHYHKGYGNKVNNMTYSHMISAFEKVGAYAKEHGVSVFNCSYDSHLDYEIFPYCPDFYEEDIDEVVN